MSGPVAIVLAAGEGARLGGDRPKAFVELSGRPMLRWAAEAALACPDIAAIIAVVPAGMEAVTRELVEAEDVLAVVPGGETRQASVRAGLAVLSRDTSVVVCHDAARPFATSALFGRVLAALDEVQGVIPVLPIPDTVKRVRDGFVVGTEPREALASAQTPQAFRADALRDAHARAHAAGMEFTDDSAALEWAGYRVRAISGERRNDKITSPEDLQRAQAMAAELVRG